MEDQTRERLVNGSVWVRGFHMLIFLIAYNIAEVLLVLLAVFQFFAVLITGKANEALLQFGRNLSVYVEEIFEFLTFNSEVRPFPFEPWPDEKRGGDQWLSDDPDDSGEVVEAPFEEVEEAADDKPAASKDTEEPK